MHHLLRILLSMPPRVALAKLWRHGSRRLGGRLAPLLNARRDPFGTPGGRLIPRLARPLRAEVERERLEDWQAHRFDLLGSGPVVVGHGGAYSGFGPHRYPPGPGLPEDWRAAITAGLRPGCRARARAILALIDDPLYRPVDWQVDFRSGHRWSTRTWWKAIAYGHRPGIDVKLPWELARLQHLPVMALAHQGEDGLAREFRNQALDFLGSNPPGWGVNWACAMDVAIRIANLLLAWDLFRANGAAFDAAFEAELAAAAYAHGAHIRANLEGGEHRGNHYLADLCGLAFCAAYLGHGDWLDLCRAELEAEILRQFLPDGGNFEASTCYHRLSAEMGLYTAALLGGLSERAMERLARAVRFTMDVTKPSGRVVQIGDNDSGRFIALDLGRESLDHVGLLAAARGLFEIAGRRGPEGDLVAALARGRRFPAALAPLAAAPRRDAVVPEGECLRLRLIPPDASALDGLEPVAYPDFGLYLWKGPRAFISVRCGAIGQSGHGGHAHNDQLAVEVEIDGVAWVRDPGSYVYTSDLAARDRYRSALAHFVPRQGTQEPARFLSPFRLEDRARAEPLRFGADFLGRHHGFGAPVWRRVAVEDGAVIIEDWPGQGSHHIRSPEELARLWGLTLPFSPGYGLLG
ncbi:hypothetical protein A6A04_12235 [Paramagnetospirillum marisnigri]|uniref:Uncharacterized protein n=1 Tax=Paramagnetospirillum marisnigri TaxID=1285242 RepID=A0A178MW72_9PROT|nr:heparinase II/III family protein [Paramagnetospirillum marisnigri]OAN54686.1 hypothetical protein A6A04_12235 [Paramagnetospirillum marisnigri]